MAEKIAPSSEHASDLDELKQMIKEQQTIIHALHEDNKKIKRHLFFIALGSNLRFLFLIVPLIFGAIYLAPFIRYNWDNLQQLLLLAEKVQNQGPDSWWSQIRGQ